MLAGRGGARPGNGGIVLERKSKARAWGLVVSDVEGWEEEGLWP